MKKGAQKMFGLLFGVCFLRPFFIYKFYDLWKTGPLKIIWLTLRSLLKTVMAWVLIYSNQNFHFIQNVCSNQNFQPNLNFHHIFIVPLFINRVLWTKIVLGSWAIVIYFKKYIIWRLVLNLYFLKLAFRIIIFKIMS